MPLEKCAYHHVYHRAHPRIIYTMQQKTHNFYKSAERNTTHRDLSPPIHSRILLYIHTHCRPSSLLESTGTIVSRIRAIFLKSAEQYYTPLRSQAWVILSNRDNRDDWRIQF